MLLPNAIKSFYKKLKMREKIFVNYLFLCIAPLALVSWLNYRTAMSHVNETITDFINLFASQLNSEIESYVASIDNISKSLLSDANALDFLSNEREYPLYDRITYRMVIESYINNMTLQKPDVRSIYIIGASEILYHSGGPDQLIDIEDFRNLRWYKKLLESTGNLVITPIASNERPGFDSDISMGMNYQTYSGEAPDTNSQDDAQQPEAVVNTTNSQFLIIGRALRDVHGISHGIIAYETKIENIIKTNPVHQRIISEYDIGIEVVNSSGEFLYKIPSKSLSDEKHDKDNRSIILSSNSQKHGLTISILIPRKTLFNKIYMIKNFNLILLFAMILLTLLLSLLFSYTITKPLSRLAKSMTLFQEQKYDIIPVNGRNDELGTLTQTYNQMVSKINTLINEVYIKKLHERKAQLIALQNQINPHMLYNTIECIRMKAALNNDDEVSDMIRDLGKIFQLTLSKGKINHTIGDEMEYITTYIRLLNNDGRYHLDIRLSEKIMEASIIRFSFQPIVENCIVHGFYNKLGKCVICISGTLKDNNILLTIEDNGVGIEAEKLSEIKQTLLAASDSFNEMKSGIGLKNVYDRIKLEYGEKYYLSLNSAEMEGTTVEMLIPYRKK